MNATTNSTSSVANPLTSTSQMGGRRRSRRMAKGLMRASRSASRSMALAGGRRRKRRGGQAYDSGNTYGTYVNGSVDSQLMRSNEPSNPGFSSVGVQGQQSVRPVQSQQGGKRRTKRGGYWGQVLSTALVPFGLWAAQNRFSKRRGVKQGGKSRKHRK